MSKAQIAGDLDKSPSTISKEIRPTGSSGLQAHTIEDLDISAQTTVNSKNATAEKTSAVLSKNEAANAKAA